MHLKKVFMINRLNLFILVTFLTVLSVNAQTNSPAKKSMYLKADSTFVVNQELNISKLEPIKEPAKEKRKKGFGIIVQIIRDLIRDNQVN